MPQTWLLIGALICALAVTAGAFGAHGLKARLDAEDLARWETASKYLMYAGFGVLAVGITALHDPRRGFDLAAILITGGGLVFSSTVATIALGGPRWLGAITPLGGLAIIVGFVVFGATAWRLTL